MSTLTSLLHRAREIGASDLHLSQGRGIVVRVQGRLQALAAQDEEQPETVQDQDTGALHSSLQGAAQGSKVVAVQDRVERALAELPTWMDPLRQQQWRDGLEVDFALSTEDGARCRVHAYRQQRGGAAALRLLPTGVPSLQALQAPPVLAELVRAGSGLLLITGATGSGKSSTLAAVARQAMAHRPLHLVTIEDPIEFIHDDPHSLISQRQVGSHTGGWSQALRAALRQDPDVVVVGEMRDLETMRLALSAAETGHLVLATLHTRGAPQAVSRIVDAFPATEKDTVRAQLADALLAVVSQCLCTTCDARARVAAHEVLVATPAVRNLIREGRLPQLPSAMQAGQSHGMQTLGQSLEALLRRGLISPAQAALQAGMTQNSGLVSTSLASPP